MTYPARPWQQQRCLLHCIPRAHPLLSAASERRSNLLGLGSRRTAAYCPPPPPPPPGGGRTAAQCSLPGCLQHDLLSLETCYRFLRLPAELYGHKPFSRLMQRGLARLVEEFGDLDEVWTDEERQAAFLAMPLEAMQVGHDITCYVEYIYLQVWGLLLLLSRGVGRGDVAVCAWADRAGRLI